DYLVRHLHVADDPGHRRDDGFLLSVVRVTQRRSSFQLDNDEAAERSGRLIELPGFQKHVLQAWDERETALELRERQLIDAGEVGEEIVMNHGHSAVTRALHVHLDDAHACPEGLPYRRYGVLDRPRRIFADIVTKAMVRDGKGPHLEFEQLVDRSGEVVQMGPCGGTAERDQSKYQDRRTLDRSHHRRLS